MNTTNLTVERETLLDAHQRILPFVHRTPVLTSHLLNEKAGTELFFKCENLQRGGSFKIRGATNAVLGLTDDQRGCGVVAHSSGNFAQAVAIAAVSVNCTATIVMPSNAPKVKIAAVRDYGGKVVLCEPTMEARQAESDRICAETGASFLHPSNDLPVILGQGTVGMELLQQQPELDVVITPVGGGGLVAGCSLAVHHFGKGCETIGSEPMAVDDAWRSLQSGKIEVNASAETIADGLRTNLGDVNFPIIQKYVQTIIRVDEDEIVEAMRLVWQRMKVVIEPSSAVPFAAVLRERELFTGKRVGLVLTGGNVDLSELPF